jgi:protein TonB
MGLIAVMALAVAIAFAQQGRKAISNPTPEYPDFAKKLNLTGVVKVEILIGTDGEIKSTNVVGGHPILVDSVLKALKKWKYAPASGETSTVLEFRFNP